MTTYERIAEAYEARFREPLVASEEWVDAFYAPIEEAVACAADENDDVEAEAVARTAATIAVATYGEEILAHDFADDPGDHPDADRPPGTDASWGEA